MAKVIQNTARSTREMLGKVQSTDAVYGSSDIPFRHHIQFLHRGAAYLHDRCLLIGSNKILYFHLKSGEKAETGQERNFFKVLFHDMLCDITQQCIVAYFLGPIEC